jgi:hypothetical protein
MKNLSKNFLTLCFVLAAGHSASTLAEVVNVSTCYKQKPIACPGGGAAQKKLWACASLPGVPTSNTVECYDAKPVACPGGGAVSLVWSCPALPHAAEKDIAHCVGEDQSKIRVYQTGSSATQLKVDFSSPGQVLNGLDTTAAQYSADGNQLQITFARGQIYAGIVRGQNTQGTMGVLLGSAPTKLTCTANW